MSQPQPVERFIVVSVPEDDPYGPQWFHGPYRDPVIAQDIADVIAEVRGRIAHVHPLTLLRPGEIAELLLARPGR